MTATATESTVETSSKNAGNSSFAWAFLALSGCLFLDLLLKLVRGLNQGFVLTEAHHWRQAFNFGVILNFASGSAELLVPRMLAILPHSSGRTNIVAMEAPLYHWILALPTRWSQQAVWPSRLFALLSLIVFVAALVQLVRRSASASQSTVLSVASTCFVVALSPMVASEFRQVQSEAPMVALASAAFLLASSQGQATIFRRYSFYIICILMVLMKPSALAYLPALCWLGVREKQWTRPQKIRHCVMVMMALLAHILWMQWAWKLLRAYNPGGPIISIQIDPANVWHNITSPGISTYLTSFVIPSIVTGYWLFPVGMLGAVHFLSRLRDRTSSTLDEAMAMALTVAMFEMVCFGDRLGSNLYYGMALLLPAMYFTSQGLVTLLETLQNTEQNRSRWLRFLCWTVALASVVARLRLHVVNTSDVSTNATQGLLANQFIWYFAKPWSIVTMLSVLLCAGVLSRLHRLAAVERSLQIVCLTVGVYLVGMNYRLDQMQFREIYAGGQERAAGARQMATLREVVQEFSTPSQLLATNHQELAILAETRRNGVVDLPPPHRVTRPNTTEDLYLYFGEVRIRTLYPQLAVGPDWQLFCLRPLGCHGAQPHTNESQPR